MRHAVPLRGLYFDQREAMYQLRARMVPKQPMIFPSKGLSDDISFVLESTRIAERRNVLRGSAQRSVGVESGLALRLKEAQNYPLDECRFVNIHARVLP
jgi:hypothetical protein